MLFYRADPSAFAAASSRLMMAASTASQSLCRAAAGVGAAGAGTRENGPPSAGSGRCRWHGGRLACRLALPPEFGVMPAARVKYSG
jgi:hypothetical protein